MDAIDSDAFYERLMQTAGEHPMAQLCRAVGLTRYPVHLLAKEFDVTRATIYRWLDMRIVGTTGLSEVRAVADRLLMAHALGLLPYEKRETIVAVQTMVYEAVKTLHTQLAKRQPSS